MEKYENVEMPHACHWRLQVAFHNKDIPEIRRLNEIWFKELRERVQSELSEHLHIRENDR